MLNPFKQPAPAEPASEVRAPPERTGLDVLAHGTIRRTAHELTDRAGKFYTRATMAVHRDGLASMPVLLLSHVPKVSFTLQAMQPGDALSVTGNLLLTDAGSVAINVKRLVSPFPTQTRKAK